MVSAVKTHHLDENRQRSCPLPSSESVERLQDYSTHVLLNSSQKPGTVLSRLDTEMSRILNTRKKDKREKWERYHRVLQRYLQFKKAENEKSASKAEPETNVGPSKKEEK